MKNYAAILILLSILIIAVLACNLPTGTPVPADDITPPQTNTTPPANPTNQSPTVEQPNVPATNTLTSSPTPSITPTATPSIPIVSVSANTNCRQGPGLVYDNISILLVGEEAEVIGKYTATDPDYWIIKKDLVTCWLWGEYATVKGDISDLPEKIPPPTPSPSPTPTATATATQTLSPTP